MRQLLAATLLVALLTGCGWQLRGGSMAALAERVLYVQTQVRGGELGATVARNLRLAGARTVESAGQAEAVLVLATEELQRRPIAVSENARVQEYELGYRLQFRLETPDGKPILADQEIVVSQVYRYDRDNVLSSQSQEVVVGDRLRQDAVRLLLPRVEAALRNQARE